MANTTKHMSGVLRIRKIGSGWTNMNHVQSKINPDSWYRTGTKKMKEGMVDLYMDAESCRASFIYNGILYEQTWPVIMTERTLTRRASKFVKTIIFRVS